MSNNVNEILAEFCEEALELLESLPHSMAQCLADPMDTESINSVFRAMHTIKGNAGFLNLPTIKQFAHTLEDILDEVRQGKIALTEQLCRALIDGMDLVGEMLSQIQQGVPDSDLGQKHVEVIDNIKQLCEENDGGSVEDTLLAQLKLLAEEIRAAEIPQSTDWGDRLIGLTKSRSSANEPDDTALEEPKTATQLFKSSFSFQGEDITPQVHAVLSHCEAMEESVFDRDNSAEFLKAVDELNEWATSKSLDQSEDIQAARDDFATILNSPFDLDANLFSGIWERLGPALYPLVRRPQKPEPEAQAESSPSPREAVAKPVDSKSEKEAGSKSRFLRVKEEHVDEFLEDVSRLFITCERLKDLQLRMARQLEMRELVDELRQINTTLSMQSTDLQRGVVELRKVPVRGLFSKFPRVARKLASDLGKQLTVRLEGEHLEIDKSLVEDLDGPLMHMIRNVCDHGIETPDERQARGAEPTGTLSLSCSLTKSHVVIVVQDDGRGIDPDRLRTKAVERGAMTTEEVNALSDNEAVNLIFDAGFSTAEKISDISGRGVGLDVVREQIRQHDGNVTVASALGEGTTFRMEIPVRKAVVVVDGLLVKQNQTTFVIPFDHIREILRLNKSEMSSVRERPMALVRGEPFTVFSMAELFKLPIDEDDSLKSRDGVLIHSKDKAAVLLVDAVIGQRKVVVSDMTDVLPCCEKLRGVAQLGGGNLALVVDTAELLDSTVESHCLVS